MSPSSDVSPETSRESFRETSPTSDQLTRDSLWLIGLGVGLALLSLLVGVALLSGILSPQRAWWSMLPVPLALAAWYAYGFLQPNASLNALSDEKTSPDYGLLLSSGGWALTVLALLISPSTPGDAASSHDISATICGALAILFLLCGAVLSWRARNEDRQREVNNITG